MLAEALFSTFLLFQAVQKPDSVLSIYRPEPTPSNSERLFVCIATDQTIDCYGLARGAGPSLPVLQRATLRAPDDAPLVRIPMSASQRAVVESTLSETLMKKAPLSDSQEVALTLRLVTAAGGKAPIGSVQGVNSEQFFRTIKAINDDPNLVSTGNRRFPVAQLGCATDSI